MSAMEKVIRDKYAAIREKTLTLDPLLKVHKDGEELSPELKKGVEELQPMVAEMLGLLDTYSRSLRVL